MAPKTLPGVEAFNAALDRVLSVSRADFEKYEKGYKRAVARNPRKPGPKPKRRASRAAV